MSLYTVHWCAKCSAVWAIEVLWACNPEAEFNSAEIVLTDVGHGVCEYKAGCDTSLNKNNIYLLDSIDIPVANLNKQLKGSLQKWIEQTVCSLYLLKYINYSQVYTPSAKE